MAQSDKKAADETAAVQPQAGTVITPGQTVDLHSAGEPAPERPVPEPQKTVVAPPKPAPTPEPPKAVVLAPEQAVQPAAATPVSADVEQSAEDPTSISWTASEFVAHDKTVGWYVLLIFAAIVFAGGIYLVTKDVISAGVILVAAIILAIFASHKPSEQQYTLDEQGITIGQKRYDYDDYKSFAIVSEGAISGLVFMPLRRFAIPLTIYYAPEDEDRVVSLLSDRLPLEEHRLDAIDNLMRKIRF